ncbi:MAG: hypothetical protein ACP5QI_08235, partial [Candidatus Bathyarchaeia archaeon]
MPCTLYPRKCMNMSGRHLRTFKILLLLFLAVVLPLSVFNSFIVGASAQSSRETLLNIQIVFIGFHREEVDLKYLDWNNPSYKYQSVLIPGVDTGVMFRFNYTYKFAPKEFEDRLIDFLASIRIEEYMKDQLWNYSFKLTHFGVSLNYTTFEADALNTFYNADAVEDWLINHIDEAGVDGEKKYTLIMADLHELVPSVTSEQFDSAVSGGETL